MTEQAISPLRRRMIEDMTVRKFAPKTQHDYLQRVKEFARYLNRSPDTAKADDVRGFQVRWLRATRIAGEFRRNRVVAESCWVAVEHRITEPDVRVARMALFGKFA